MKKQLYKQLYPAASKQGCVIGAAGAEKGCGATHFIWSAANYLSNVKGNRVAVCNLSGEADYGQAKVILGKTGEGPFCHCGITFFEQADETTLAKPARRYDCVLLDLGCEERNYKELLLRCDRRFLIGALNEWRCKSFITAALRLKELYGEEITALAAFYSASGIRNYKAAVKRNIEMIPYEPEPFRLHKDMLALMDKVFGENFPYLIRGRG